MFELAASTKFVDQMLVNFVLFLISKFYEKNIS